MSLYNLLAIFGDWKHCCVFLFQAMWLILQQENPDDFVISTNETHSVREFVEKAFRIVKIDIEYVALNKIMSLVRGDS